MSDPHGGFVVSFADGGDTGPVLSLRGDLDTASSEILVDSVASRRPLSGLTIDTEALSFVDSAGLRAMLAVREMVEADAGEATRLCNVSSDLRRLLQICGLSDVFVEVDARA